MTSSKPRIGRAELKLSLVRVAAHQAELKLSPTDAGALDVRLAFSLDR
jgi:hypothetical protein